MNIGRQYTYDLGDEDNIPGAEVWGVYDYTGPERDWEDTDSPEWGRVIGQDGHQWKGYKGGYKTYMDWPELLRRWGPVTVNFIDPDYTEPAETVTDA